MNIATTARVSRREIRCCWARELLSIFAANISGSSSRRIKTKMTHRMGSGCQSCLRPFLLSTTFWPLLNWAASIRPAIIVHSFSLSTPTPTRLYLISTLHISNVLSLLQIQLDLGCSSSVQLVHESWVSLTQAGNTVRVRPSLGPGDHHIVEWGIE